MKTPTKNTSLIVEFQIVWFSIPSVTESKVPVVADVVAGAEKTGETQNEMKIDEEKKEGSDDEDIEEEERSWRRGYDAE